MRIAVIAANGRSGKAFVAKALEAGHQVNAGVHSSSSYEESAVLKVFKGDATNKEDMKKLITGTDAVVSLIGHRKGSPKDVQFKALENIIEVMSELKVVRLISLTGTGVRFPGDKITLIDRVLNFIVRSILSDMIEDGINTAELIKKSSLEWTIIRGLILTNGAEKPYKLTPHGPAKTMVSRNEVATAIIELLENKSFIKQAPIISKN